MVNNLEIFIGKKVEIYLLSTVKLRNKDGTTKESFNVRYRGTVTDISEEFLILKTLKNQEVAINIKDISQLKPIENED